jgi:hypothetical protein
MAVLVGCASSGGGSSGGGETLSGGGDARVITQAEILRLGVSNAFEAVERLHPVWLISGGTRARSTRLPSEIVVIANEQYFGPPASLRQFPAGVILEIRYVLGSDAINRYPQLANGRFVEAAIIVRQIATQR